MRRLIVHPSAKREIAAAAAHYSAIDRKLKKRFQTELDTTITKILAYPTALALHFEQTRRYRLDTFPYGVVYMVEPEVIYVVAVTHLRQEPGYWRNRL